MNFEQILEYFDELESGLQSQFKKISGIAIGNQAKMLDAFQTERIGTHHFQTTNGYGYHDIGRDALERVFARVFRAEAALVRQQLVSGTHAIACSILGNLSPGDEMLIGSGVPYETLHGVLGLNPGEYEGASQSGGFKIKIIDLAEDGSLNSSKILSSINEKTKLIAFQRSCGYSEEYSFAIKEFQNIFSEIKNVKSDLLIFVDNCYGEFVEEMEPLEVGADLVAGSLIKNPGGCIIPCGGYIAGKECYVEKAAERLYAPGIGGEIGPSLINTQLFFQGFFESPHRVSEMVKGAVLTARVFEKAGYRVAPLPEEPRTDIIQKIYFDSAEKLIQFCRLVQQSSPVASDVIPEPAPMPGYHHHVIMGGGTFISGATSEFSADAPLAPPYIAFLQGGLSYTQIKLSLAKIFKSLN